MPWENRRLRLHADADVMIAGGAESTVSPLAIGAFAQMRALSTGTRRPGKGIASL